MSVLRVIAAVVLGIVSFAVSVGNWEIALSAARRGEWGSRVPLLGGVSGALAIAIAPWRYHPWWPVPLILDLGSLPMAVQTLVFLARRRTGRR